MARTGLGERFTLIGTSAEKRLDDLAEAVRDGLTGDPKRLPSRFFYDRDGSRLFEEICDLPEYYLTRAEDEILRREACRLVDSCPQDVLLVELGSGSAVKTRHLVEALLEQNGALSYVPVDISPTILQESAVELLGDYPDLEVIAVAGEYRQGLRRLADERERPKWILWLGSNIGNLERDDAVQFLGQVRTTMSRRDRLLVGIDLRKDREVLERAYNDARGVTARFNLNVLARINRELDGEFDLGSFEHRAFYNERPGRIEMHLVSKQTRKVPVGALNLEISFEAGESIHTENSYKYSLREVEDLARNSGLKLENQWLDGEGRFSLNLLAVGPDRDRIETR